MWDLFDADKAQTAYGRKLRTEIKVEDVIERYEVLKERTRLVTEAVKRTFDGLKS